MRRMTFSSLELCKLFSSDVHIGLHLAIILMLYAFLSGNLRKRKDFLFNRLQTCIVSVTSGGGL